MPSSFSFDEEGSERAAQAHLVIADFLSVSQVKLGGLFSVVIEPEDWQQVCSWGHGTSQKITSGKRGCFAIRARALFFLLATESAETPVFRFRSFEDGDVGVGVLPECEELLVLGSSLRGFA
jgi:hypothetical protein